MLRLLVAAAVLGSGASARGAELLPPAGALRPDRPRILLRPHATPYAVSLAQLRGGPRGAEYDQLLSQLRNQRHAAAQALVWLLAGDRRAADRAIQRLRAYRFPGRVDTFHIYGRLTEFGLAYDWLYDYPGFGDKIKADVRARVAPLVEQALRVANDHMFHNYIWMSAGGAAVWTLATAGEDADADAAYERVRRRFNEGLYPAWKYLDGLPSEPMGYWALYVYTPGVLALLGAQSASETDVIGAVREDGDWLARHFENLIHSTLPNMRYLPWGDLQSGPNGGVTHEMAGIIDATTWALKSPHGAWFSRWLAAKRGPARFYGETAMYYMIYTRRLRTAPEPPPLSFLAGGPHSAHFIARSGWGDGDTVVALTSTDHMGDHHHYDQGSFIMYRNGLLAVDPPVYRHVRGPQQKTENHNTLLVGGQPQRPVRGQWFVTIEDFQKNLRDGRRLETGDMPLFSEAGDWAAAAAQFAQAYPEGLAASCVRQLVFLRPLRVLVVDQLEAPAGKRLPETAWLLQLPAAPRRLSGGEWVAADRRSWIRCRALGRAAPPASSVEATDVGYHRLRLTYRPQGRRLVLVHLLDVGDGAPPAAPAPEARVEDSPAGTVVALAGRRFRFAARPPFSVWSP